MELGEGRREVFELRDQEVDDAHFLLQSAVGQHDRGGAGDASIAFPDVLADDQVGHAGFVFDGDEGDAVGGAGALAEQDDAGDGKHPADGQGRQLVGRHDLAFVEHGAEKGHGMAAQRQAGRAVVGEDFMEGGHPRQGGRRLVELDGIEERELLALGERLPQGDASAQLERTKGIRLGQLFQGRAAQAGPANEIAQGSERPGRQHDRIGMGPRKAAQHAEAQAEGEG